MAYGGFVKFDHDFIGKEALEKMAQGPHRQKVTLALDDDDVMRAIGTMFNKQIRAKYFDSPSAVYCMHPYDRVICRIEARRHLDLDRLHRPTKARC